MYKTIKATICSVIMFILIVSLAGCSKKDENKILKEKIESEIKYLDTQLIGILNKTNGISFENYIVEAEKIKAEEEENNNQSGSSNQQQTGETKEKSDQSQKDSSESSSTSMKYKMVGNEILIQEKNTDWQGLKSDIEKMYSDWTTIMLDLYKVNVNSQNILSFNTDLDVATQAIKNEDKQKSLNAIAKLYSYIPIYSEEVLKNAETNSIYKIKSNIVNACVLVEQANLSQAKNELVNAEQSFLPIVNNMTNKSTNEANINKAYVLIKDLQNSIDSTDKDVFYIKYKNLIQQLSIINEV